MIKSPLIYVSENISNLLKDEQIIGHYVYDMFDEVLGRVEGLLVERSSYFPRYMVYVQGGVLSTRGKTILVPAEIFNSPEFGKIQIPKSVQWLKDVPSPHDVKDLLLEEEELVLEYFSMPYYWDEESTDDTRESTVT